LITESLSTLKIHKLTQAQYERERDAGRIDTSALYLTPDEVNNQFTSIILLSAGGKKFKIMIDDDGVLLAAELTD
jgi:hypothetical protein